MLLAHPEKEKRSDLFFFTSDWHLTGCLPGWQVATAFSGNTVNVYTGDQHTGTDDSLSPFGSGIPRFCGVNEPILWC